MFNNMFFKELHDKSLEASKWLADKFGEPEWCKGYGVRNTHRLAIAPTKSTALLIGGVSEGINPDPAMVFTQASAAGEIERVNPVLLKLMKEKGVYNKKNSQQIVDARGSVQAVEWLTDEEKKVFKTAFEIDQRTVLRLASVRGKWLDQWQSLNLFFAAEEDPAYVARIHQEAFMDEGIRALYYIYSKAGVVAAKDVCEACQ
jgi:ribonucleoside-diphosphate reductase alpha chain